METSNHAERPAQAAPNKPNPQDTIGISPSQQSQPGANFSDEQVGMYEYAQLPNDGEQFIRVATICPGKFEDDININIEQRRFEPYGDKQEYQALSYAWGLPQEEHEYVYVSTTAEGEAATSKKLPVRDNLISALRHIRHTTEHVKIWADAICIDQGNDTERAAQVVMMGDIFSAARQVTVWLGPAAENSEIAVAALRDIAAPYQVDWLTLRLLPEILPVPDNLCGEEIWDAIYRLFSRSWFERLWVRQEIMLADQEKALVRCGNTTIAWRHLLAAWISIFSGSVGTSQYVLLLYNRLAELSGFLGRPQYVRMTDLRNDFGSGKCADPRDRIYSVRAMLEPSVRVQISPDYTKPVVEVYRDAVTAFFNTANDLSILTQCQYSPQWAGNPSWVPDWSYAENPPKSLNFQMASGMLRAPWTFDDKKVLVPGVIVSTITGFNCPDISDIHRSEHLLVPRAIGALLGLVNGSLDGAYPEKITVGDAIAMTICDNMFQGNWNNEGNARVEYATAKEAVQKVHDGTFDDWYARRQYDMRVRRLRGQVSHSCWGRGFLKTDQGHLGLAPPATQPGDKIAILLGCHQLTVLRPVESGRYIIIGECFVYGLAYGEKLLGPIADDTNVIYRADGPSRRMEHVFQETSAARTAKWERYDPRLEILGKDLTSYREQLARGPRQWLDLDADELAQLKTRCDGLETIELV